MAYLLGAQNFGFKYKKSSDGRNFLMERAENFRDSGDDGHYILARECWKAYEQSTRTSHQRRMGFLFARVERLQEQDFTEEIAKDESIQRDIVNTKSDYLSSHHVN